MKVETYSIKGWKKKETGLLISENKDWILVKHIPFDYLVDGYKLYPKKFIKNRKTKEIEKHIEKVLKLKKVKAQPPKGFKFRSIVKTLNWLEKRYGLFEFQDKYEDELFYGKVNKIKKDSLFIDMINANGAIEENYDFNFKLNKIRSITFDSDYFKSITLLMNKA